MLTYDELAQQDDYRVLRGARAAMLSYVINVPRTISATHRQQDLVHRISFATSTMNLLLNATFGPFDRSHYN